MQKRASDKNLKVVDEVPTNKPTNQVEDEFTAMATSRSTPQQEKKGTTSVMDELMGLDSQWSGSGNTGFGGNSPWGASSVTPSVPQTNPFGSMGVASNPWGGNTGGG